MKLSQCFELLRESCVLSVCVCVFVRVWICHSTSNGSEDYCCLFPCHLGWRTSLKCNKTNHACLLSFCVFGWAPFLCLYQDDAVFRSLLVTLCRLFIWLYAKCAFVDLSQYFQRLWGLLCRLVCVCVLILCLYEDATVFWTPERKFVCMYVCVCVCVCVCVYIHANILIYIHIDIHTHKYTAKGFVRIVAHIETQYFLCVCWYVSLYVCTYICVCIYIYIYMSVYTHNTHEYTCMHIERERERVPTHTRKHILMQRVWTSTQKSLREQ
jgi:hypothetical protein